MGLVFARQAQQGCIYMPDRNPFEPESPLDVSPFKASGLKQESHTLLMDYLAGLRFYTRLPVSEKLAGQHVAPDFATLARVVPLVGATVGLVGLASIVMLSAVGLQPFLAACLSVAVLVAVTGAFHEDGLADTADGLGGGQTRERKLEIMKDSRLGTYGTITLLLTSLLRIGAIAVLIDVAGAFPAGLAVLASETLSRTSALFIATLLPPARQDGAAFAAGRPERDALITAGFLALIILVLTIWNVAGPAGLLLMTFAGFAGTAGLALLARQQLGGQTGDVAGAAQQINLVAMLLVASLLA